ncbi:MAG: M24 family metallopeptidase [Promethearchaeota archaeon]
MQRLPLNQRVAVVMMFLFLSGSLAISAAHPVSGLSDSFRLSTLSDAEDASEITATAFMHAKNFLRRAYNESFTQQDVCDYVEQVMRLEGADARLSFPTLVMSGSEMVEPHGNPHDDDTHVVNPAAEPIVMIDMGSRVNGHCSDVTRTFLFEGATAEMLDAYAAVIAAEEAIIDAIGPGTELMELAGIYISHLNDYIGEPGITTLEYWGHGLGDWVHQGPYLSTSSQGSLSEGMVLAIEPGIYSDDGWAVRVEDTVLVTATGHEVLSSSMPKAIEDVTITTDDPLVTVDLDVIGYEYESMTSLSLTVDDSDSRVPDLIRFFNGYLWVDMVQHEANLFTRSFTVGYLYSEILHAAFWFQLDGREYYWLEELVATPSESIAHALDPAIVVSETGDDVFSPVSWTVEHSGASMIRAHFSSLVSPVWDQFSILDGYGRVVIEYKDVNMVDVWSPWIAGEELRIIAYPTESSGMDSFSFTVDSYEIVNLLTTSITTTTTSTVPSAWTPPPNTTTTNNLPEEIDLTAVYIAGAVALAAIIVVVVARDLR